MNAWRTQNMGRKNGMHLHHVKQAFGYLTFLDKTCRGLMRGHLNRRVVVGGANDQIRLGNDPAHRSNSDA